MPPRSWSCRSVCHSRRGSAARPRPAPRLIGARLLPLGDVRLGDRLHRQDLVLRQLLAIEVVRDHLRGLEPGPGRDLGAGAVLLAGLDPGNTLLQTVAADDDQLALVGAQRNARRLSGLHDGGGLVIGHAVHHVQPALRGVARKELAGNTLAEVGLPLGVLDRHDLSFRLIASRNPATRRGPTPSWSEPVTSAILPPSRPP